MNTPESYQKPNGGSRSLKRMVRRLQLSEEVCQELRHILTSRVVDQDWSRICTMLHKWMKYAPKDVRYSRPPNDGTHRREAAVGDFEMQTSAESAASRSVQ